MVHSKKKIITSNKSNKAVVFLGSTNYAIRIFTELAYSQPNYNFYIIVEDFDIQTNLWEQGTFVDKNNIFNNSELMDKEFLAHLISIEPIVALSVNYMKILPEIFYLIPKYGTINLHPSLLPYNRGNWPEFRSIMNQTAAGAILHYIDSGIDTGPIIAQSKVKVESWDTGESSSTKVEMAGEELIKTIWQEALSFKLPAIKQTEKYKLNKSEDMDKVLQIDIEKAY